MEFSSQRCINIAMVAETQINLAETAINGGLRRDYLTFTGEVPDPGDVFGCMTLTFLGHPAFARLEFTLSDATDSGLRLTGPDINDVLSALNTSTDTVPRLIWSIPDNEADPSPNDGYATLVLPYNGKPAELQITTAAKSPLIRPEDIIAGLVERFSPETN